MRERKVGLSTHVLDTARGRPAAGMTLQLWRLDGAAGELRSLLAETRTNEDGRLPALLLEGELMQPGVYELVFFAAMYFSEVYDNSEGLPSFLDTIPIRFTITTADEHYHVPLLLAPGGYSTYRGS